jgi:hypothetical protein
MWVLPQPGNWELVGCIAAIDGHGDACYKGTRSHPLIQNVYGMLRHSLQTRDEKRRVEC